MSVRLLRPLRNRGQRGQVAVGFVILMGLMILLTPPLMNLGEVARLKTATANAADAGALAGASMVASGTNYLARVARAMMVHYWAVWLYVFRMGIFCWQLALWYPWLLGAGLYLRNYWILKRMIADPMMGLMWDQRIDRALMTALQNTAIDDPTGQVQADIRAYSESLEDSDFTADTFFRTEPWLRDGIVPEESWVQVELTVPPSSAKPNLEMDQGNLLFWMWDPFLALFTCLFGACFPAVGWRESDLTWQRVVGYLSSAASSGGSAQLLKQNGAGPHLAAWADAAFGLMVAWAIRPRVISFCNHMTLFPIPIPVRVGPIRPTGISNSSGTITVKVTHHRESGARLAFWTMNYPDVVSSATAEYGGSHVRPNPFRAGDRAVVDLITVDAAAGGG